MSSNRYSAEWPGPSFTTATFPHSMRQRHPLTDTSRNGMPISRQTRNAQGARSGGGSGSQANSTKARTVRILSMGGHTGVPPNLGRDQRWCSALGAARITAPSVHLKNRWTLTSLRMGWTTIATREGDRPRGEANPLPTLARWPQAAPDSWNAVCSSRSCSRSALSETVA